MLSAGLDMGSVATKAVVLSDGEVGGRALLRTGTEPGAAGREALRQAFEQAGIEQADVPLVATGYGRRATESYERTMPEIQAAALGVHELVPAADALIDLGGQDTKAIRLAPDGSVAQFAMNDKCAAGTGRFLELMSSVLGRDLDRLGALAEESDSPARMDSTCAVFAESEVVSLIAQGVPERDIAAGLFAAIASRVAALTGELGIVRRVAFIGGGAKGLAMKNALQTELGTELCVPEYPQFAVALGAALAACES